MKFTSWCPIDCSDTGALVFVMYRPRISAYCGGLYMSGENDRDQVVSIAKTESLGMPFRSFLETRCYRHD